MTLKQTAKPKSIEIWDLRDGTCEVVVDGETVCTSCSRDVAETFKRAMLAGPAESVAPEGRFTKGSGTTNTPS